MVKNRGRRGRIGSPSAWPGALCLELLINNGLCVKKLKQQTIFTKMSVHLMEGTSKADISGGGGNKEDKIRVD